MKTPYDGDIEREENEAARRTDRIASLYLQKLWARREGYLAALQSPEVTALRKALAAVLADLKDGWISNDSVRAERNRDRHIKALVAADAPWKEETP